MLTKKNKSRIVIFTAIFVIVSFFAFGYLQTFFVSQENILVQYHIGAGDVGIATSPSGDYFNALGGTRGNFIGPSNTASNSNALSASTLSDRITINNGKHSYEFIATKTGDGRNFGLEPSRGAVGGNVLYCWQKVEVKKDGVLVDTFESWDDIQGSLYNHDYFKTNRYVVYDDNNQNSGIRMTMEDLGEGMSNARFYGNCRVFVNRYQLFYDNETLDISLNVPQQSFEPGQNISVTVIIENNLNIPVSSEVSTEFSVGTFLGLQTLSNIQTINLQPGINEIVFNIPAPDESEDIDVRVNAKLSLTGSELQNLNFGEGTLTLGVCFNTNSQGGCEQYNIRNNAGASPAIQSSQKVDIGSFVQAESILQVSLSPSGNNITLQTNNSGTVIRVSNKPPIVSQPSPSSILSTTTSRTYAIVFGLIIAVVLIVVIGIFTSKRRRRRR